MDTHQQQLKTFRTSNTNPMQARSACQSAIDCRGDGQFGCTAVVQILLYAAVLTLLVSRELLGLVIQRAGNNAVFPPERWAATFRSHA